MDNSAPKMITSTSSVIESSDDIKVFVKLCSKEESSNLNRRVYFFEENREELVLQKGSESIQKYKYDYIFSDYENTLLISNSITSMIEYHIRNEKNICFFTFGEDSLCKSNFLFGTNKQVVKDSFFKFTFDSIFRVMSEEFQVSNVLIDVFMISDEKFVLDCQNIHFDSNYDIVDMINRLQSSKSNSSNTINSECFLENGHFIITLKFFRFVTDSDINSTKRMVDFVRTISFVDIEGFDSSFTEMLMQNRPVYVTKEPKLYTLNSFKNLVESMKDKNLNQFSEVKSILCHLIINILRNNNLSVYFFGFIDQNEKSILNSTVTLEIMKKIKYLNAENFFEVLHELNINVSNLNDENILKEEYLTVEKILSEIIFYIEKITRETLKIIFDHDFYEIVKDLPQLEKYIHLENYLLSKNFQISEDPQLKNIFDCVISFKTNRSRWNKLSEARDEILKLNGNGIYKESESSHKLTVKSIKLNTKEGSEISKISIPNKNFIINNHLMINDDAELKSVCKDLSKINSIFEDPRFVSSLDNHNFSVTSIKPLIPIEKSNASTKSNTDDKDKTSEPPYIKQIMKSFLKNMQNSAKNIYQKFTEEDNKCMPCRQVSQARHPVNFREMSSQHNYFMHKSTLIKKDKNKFDLQSMDELKKESIDIGNMKTTNMKSYNNNKTYEAFKNSETNFNKNMVMPKRNESIRNQNYIVPEFSILSGNKQESIEDNESIHIFKDEPKRNDLIKNVHSISSVSAKKEFKRDGELEKRMSKIEEKMNNFESKLKNSQVYVNNNNLDSRVRSENDRSQYDESRIITKNSFYSLNL